MMTIPAATNPQNPAMRTVLLAVACLATGCGGPATEPSSSASAVDPGHAETATDGEPPSVFRQRLDDDEMVRFVTFLPTFADALDEHRRGDPHADRWRVQPLARPEANTYLWQRVGPLVEARFGRGFGGTWLKVWSAFAALQTKTQLEQNTARLRSRLRDAALSAKQRQAIRRQLDQESRPDAAHLLLSAVPAENVERVQSYARELDALSARLFGLSNGR